MRVIVNIPFKIVIPCSEYKMENMTAISAYL